MDKLDNNDFKFKQRCAEYGLDWDNIKVYENMILVSTSIENLYVIFDKSYNVIGVEKMDCYGFDIDSFYERYSNFTDLLPFGGTFSYPFNGYSLKDFIELSDRIYITEANHGHSLRTRINGEWFDRNNTESIEYFELISYIKFIGERIKEYFKIDYHMKSMGFETVDIYSYVRQLIDNINNYIEYSVKINKKRPLPIDILSSIGLNNKINYDGLLYDVSDLLMRENGVRIKKGLRDDIESFLNTQGKKDLSIFANDLLKLLKVPEEAVKEKEDSIEFQSESIEKILKTLDKKDLVMVKK